MKNLLFVFLFFAAIACSKKEDDPKPAYSTAFVSQGHKDTLSLLTSHPWKLDSSATFKITHYDSTVFKTDGTFYEKSVYPEKSCFISGDYSLLNGKSNFMSLNTTFSSCGDPLSSNQIEILRINETSLKVKTNGFEMLYVKL